MTLAEMETRMSGEELILHMAEMSLSADERERAMQQKGRL